MAAAAIPAGNSGQAPKRTTVGADDEILGEITPEVSDFSLQFAGLPQEEIVRIFHNKFKPINLYRLRHTRGLSFEAYQDEERIGIKDGMLKLRKTSRSYKDYDSTFFVLEARRDRLARKL